MSKRVMSSRGTVVDFNVLKAKERIANKKTPPAKVVKTKPTVSPATMKKLLSAPIEKKPQEIIAEEPVNQEEPQEII